MLHELTNKTIGSISGGAAGLIIDESLKAALDDLKDRGADGKPRTVSIKLTMAVVDGAPRFRVEANATLPPFRTGGTTGAFRRRTEKSGEEINTIVFEDHGGRPDQPMLPDFEDKPAGGDAE